MKIKIVVHEAEEGGYCAEVPAMRYSRRQHG
jgi:predicted RNase H-like HicB family nuclease